jgi:CRISPR-associated endonuclease Cas2
MSIKENIARGTDANLHISFDVGHSSIGWAVLQTSEPLEIKGCGSVVFRADDCLASSRRAYRRQRRHIRSTKQRIARMKILLKHLGVLTEKELDKPGCAWPWKLAAQVLQGGNLLTWRELWDVLRWYQMMQFSVYARACVSFARQETHIDRLKKHLPPEGSVRGIFVTRSQWERSYVIQGSPASEVEAEDLPEQIQLW